MQQALMHLYFYTVLEKLQTCQFIPSKLVKMITETEEVYTNVTTYLVQIIWYSINKHSWNFHNTQIYK